MENNSFIQKLLGACDKFSNNRYVRTISQGMMGILPIMMIDTVATLISAINIGGSQAFMESTGILTVCSQIGAMTSDIISLYVAFVLGYKLCESFPDKEGVDPLTGGIFGVMGFLIITPGAEGLTSSMLGSAGMITAIIVGLLATRLYIFVVDRHWTIKLPDVVPPIVSKGFAAIIPGCIVGAVFAVVFAVMQLTPYGNLSNMIYSVIQTPLMAMGSNIFTAMFLVAFIEFLWFFGMHGVMCCMPIIMALWMPNNVANLTAYGAGEALPFLFTMTFVLGNRGARSMAVVIHSFTTCKSERIRAVGKVGVVPALFGISEPVKFGIPQVMNIRMLIPLMVTPAVSVLIAYLLTIVGFLPYDRGVQLPTGFPIIINGFFMNGWQGVVAQLLELAACYVIYIPFMRWEDKIALAEEAAARAAKLQEAAEA